MSDTHDEPTPFGKGVGIAAGIILALFVAAVAASRLYDGVLWVIYAYR